MALDDWTLPAVLFGIVIALVTLVTLVIRRTFKGSVKIAVASILGIFAGIACASHGPGEILQGNIAPNGIMIEAWPELASLGGEPAMTLIPNFFVTGILAIIFGILVTIWAALCIKRKNGGLVLILLSLIMLTIGGGIIPPMLGVIAGIISIRIWQGNKLSV
jgi:hypothetical protein